MKKSHLFVLVLMLIIVSCKHKGSSVGKANAGDDSTHFFQVSQYVNSQIEEVNKTPYFIYKITITNANKDSVAISTPQFVQLAQPFLKPDISSPDLKKNYTENIFHDQTTKTFTISYSTTNKELEIQNLDILLEEDGKTVRRIFMRKFFSYPDSSAFEQLSWKASESFQINRVVNTGDNKENTQQTIVVWNAKS
jgi:hypothetical protein